MKKVDVVFVVVTYRTTKDLEDFVRSISEKFVSFKIVIVNSYFDAHSMNEMKKVALENDCDFINVENRGYGFGNNCGIKFCKENYDFKYLIISNPDIVVLKNDFDTSRESRSAVVYAPKITTLSGKQQNPYWVVKNHLAEYFIYYGYKKKKIVFVYLGFAINKFIRIIFHKMIKIFGRKKYRIFAAHGAFVVFSRKAINKFEKVYDEKMFLFAEEALLAHVLSKNKIPIYYIDRLAVKHKEDGSISVADIDENSELRKSIIYYYEKLKNRGWV